MTRLALLAGSVGLAFALLPGCSQAINTIDGATTVVCSVHTSAGEASCVIDRDFPSSETTSLQNDCTSNGGTLVASCPTAGLVGCCTTSEATLSTEVCSYAGTASQLKSQCGSGTWSTTQ